MVTTLSINSGGYVSRSARASILAWDKSTNTWVERSQMKMGRYKHAASVVEVDEERMKYCK